MTEPLPIIRFGSSVPRDLREWARVLRHLNDFVKQAGAEFQVSPDVVLPSNESHVNGVRTFLPHQSVSPPPIEAQIEAIKPFLARAASPIPANDSQVLLAAQIFGAH
jgi:hypothetical protein